MGQLIYSQVQLANPRINIHIYYYLMMMLMEETVGNEKSLLWNELNAIYGTSLSHSYDS
jgi:hypothetical protein